MATSVTLTFAPGETEKTVLVPVLQDQTYLNPYFLFSLSNPSMGEITRNQVGVRIDDDDPPPAVGFDELAYSAAEGGRVRVTLIRTNPGIPLTVWIDLDGETKVQLGADETTKSVDLPVSENACFSGVRTTSDRFTTCRRSAAQ